MKNADILVKDEKNYEKKLGSEFIYYGWKWLYEGMRSTKCDKWKHILPYKWK